MKPVFFLERSWLIEVSSRLFGIVTSRNEPDRTLCFKSCQLSIRGAVVSPVGTGSVVHIRLCFRAGITGALGDNDLDIRRVILIQNE